MSEELFCGHASVVCDKPAAGIEHSVVCIYIPCHACGIHDLEQLQCMAVLPLTPKHLQDLFNNKIITTAGQLRSGTPRRRRITWQQRMSCKGQLPPQLCRTKQWKGTNRVAFASRRRQGISRRPLSPAGWFSPVIALV